MTSESVETLCKQRAALEISIFKQDQALKRDMQTLEGIKKMILLTCMHYWKSDEKQQLCAFDRRDLVCEKCQSRNVPPGR
jgi:hypothetical protein